MLILLALVFAVAVGLVVHFTMPDRPTRGVVLAPAVATAAAAIVYTVLTWLGIGEDDPWLWVASLLAPIVSSWTAVLVFSRARRAHDAAEQKRLRIA